MSIRLLDCTLRDGGYVNNWEFDNASAKQMMEGLYQSGAQIIEIGILGKGGRAGEQTLFSNFEDMEPLMVARHDNCEYALMTNAADLDQFEIPRRSNKTVDSIRIAFFKTEWKKAMGMAKDIKEKGYKVYLQTMASFMYSEDEFEELIDAVNQVKPYAFYMVDSFGTMMTHDVTAMEEMIASRLDTEIVLGFHAHNNMQMAFANVVAFLEQPVRHNRIVDSSIYGMGRGAGNAPTELVMNYLNTTFSANYELSAVEILYDNVIAPIFGKYYWGYSMNYMITARHKLNTAYGWYLGVKGVKSATDFDTVVSKIDADNKTKFNKALIDKFISELK